MQGKCGGRLQVIAFLTNTAVTRKIWPDEARHFTPWLLANADALADALGIELELHEAERAVGDFSLDLYGRDLTHDATLIVENQLEATDHRHLGQLLTYAAGTDARTIVWTAPSFRDEHRVALEYLNRMTGDECRFFGVEIGVVRIGDSAPAPLFRVQAQPSEFRANVQRAAPTGGARAERYTAFWASFFHRVDAVAPDLTRSRNRTGSSWVMLRSTQGLQYCVTFTAHERIRSELYIDTGDADTNLRIHDLLQAQRAEIEAAFGGPLEFEGLLGKRACRVAAYTHGSVDDVAAHGAMTDWFISTSVALRAAISDRASSARHAAVEEAAVDA